MERDSTLVSTYAEVTLTVTIPLSQPWSDDETAKVVRDRAKRQATEELTIALQKGKLQGVIKQQALILIYSKEDR